jgi:hypothetical protein
MVLMMPIKPPQNDPPYNFIKTNWKEFDEKLALTLRSILSSCILTCDELENYAEQLIDIISKAI